MLRFIQHRILAARRNHKVFHAIAVKIAKGGLEIGQHRKLRAKLLLDKRVVHFAVRWLPLRESWCQQHEGERQEEKCFSHGYTLALPSDLGEVTKVTWEHG